MESLPQNEEDYRSVLVSASRSLLREHSNKCSQLEANDKMCEDYPCCGHSAGDCPDSQGRFKCTECGKTLKKNASSSICPRCMKRMLNREYRGYDSDFDHDYSMNY